MRRFLPNERFLYYGDNLNAPYGTRSEEEIRSLTFDSVQVLLDRGVKALVIACNTATSAAAEALRSSLTLPIIGMEPALKPAALKYEGGTIIVMATPATLRQNKFKCLMQHYGAGVQMLPCPELVEFVERGEIDSPALSAYLAERFAPYRGRKVDAVVLGCTHFVFARGAIERAMPGAELFDGNEGTARHLEDVLRSMDLLNPAGPGSVEILTSGDPAIHLPVMNALYNLPMDD